MVALSFALVLNSVFTKPWIAISAFLLPAIECQLALLFLDQIRSSKAFLFLAFSLSLSTMAVALELKTPSQVLVVICCVNIVWFGLFQLGLDLADLVQFSELYGLIMAGMLTRFISKMLSRGEPVVWAWAYPVPVFLTIGINVLKYCAADAGAGDGGGGAVAGDIVGRRRVVAILVRN